MSDIEAKAVKVDQKVEKLSSHSQKSPKPVEIKEAEKNLNKLAKKSETNEIELLPKIDKKLDKA